jgi:hypothetical protein
MNVADTARRHHLLPHERWFATRLLARQRTHRTPTILRMEYNYGREGITLCAAALAGILPAGVLEVAGSALLVMSQGQPPLFQVGTLMDFGAMAVVIPGLVRVLQSMRAGQVHRGTRSYLRSGVPPQLCGAVGPSDDCGPGQRDA